MAATAEGHNVLEGVGGLRISKFPDSLDMMHVRVTTDLLLCSPAMLARVVVSLKCLPTYSPPLLSVFYFTALPLMVIFAGPIFRQPVRETVPTTELPSAVPDRRRKNLHPSTTILALLFDSFGFLDVRFSEELFALLNAVRTKNPLLVGRIVFEYLITDFTFR